MTWRIQYTGTYEQTAGLIGDLANNYAPHLHSEQEEVVA